MKWTRPDKMIAHIVAEGLSIRYEVKQYFLLDMQWVIELFQDGKYIIRIPGMFNTARKAKKVCELIEKG